MYRNVAGQKIRVYAYNVTTGLPVTGDAANITAIITKDDGTPASSNDTNPTEVDAVAEKGYYDFNLTQAESNAGKLSFTAQSTTANVIVFTVGGPVIYTIPQYFSLFDLDSDGSISNINGTGARSVTITVNDGSVVLQGAKVRVSQGAESYVIATNASGVAAFSLDDATWTVQITKPGYTFTTTTLVVDGNETQTYSMTYSGISIPSPSGPTFSTGYIYCYDTDGELESNVQIYCRLLSGTGLAGYAFDTTEFIIVSDSDGLATHNGFSRGAKYRFRRGLNGPLATMSIPDSDSFELPGIIGSP